MHALLGLCILVIVGGAGPASAGAGPRDTQAPGQAADAGSAALPSVKQVESKLQEIESATWLDEATKTALGEQYRRALANLESLRSYNDRAAEYTKSLETAPTETTRIRERLAGPQTPEAGDGAGDEADLSAEEIATRLNKVQADAAIQETRIGELEKMIDEGAARPNEARARITALKQALDEVDSQLAQPAAIGPTDAVAQADLAQASRWAMETRRQALWAEGRMLEQELVSQSARDTLNKARRDEAARTLAALKSSARQLEDLRSQRRKAEAEEAQRQSDLAQRKASDKHPAVQAVLEENAAITASLTQLAEQLDRFDDQLADIEATRKRVEEDYRGARQRIEAAGLNKALGQLLLDRRNALPDLRKYRKAISNREDQIAEASLRQIRFREEQRQLYDAEASPASIAGVDPKIQTPEVRKQLEEAIDQRRTLLAKGLSTEEDYIRQLGELNYASERLIEATTVFEDYLSEHLLWVRSEPPVGADTLRELPGGVAWLLAPQKWGEVAQVLAEQARGSPPFWLLLLAVAALLSRDRTLRRAIRASAEPLRRLRTDGFGHTVGALLRTLIIALPVPLLLFAFGRALAQPIDATQFTRAFGDALIGVAVGLYYLRAFRLLCMPGGLADRHFQWSPDVLIKLRRDFDWFTAFIVPASLIALTVYNFNDPANNASLGRVALVAVMTGFAIFFARLLNPKSGVLRHFLAEHPQGLLNRLRNLWFPIAVGAPLAMGVLTMVGYLYTAGTLFQSLVQQTWLVMGLVVLHQTIVRWLMVTRRRLALQAAVDRQAARRAQATADRGDPEAASVIAQADEYDLNLASLDEQTRKLIGASVFFAAVVGMWLIWSGVLPAFHVLDQFALWHYTGIVSGTEQSIPVTAADVGLLLVIVFVAVVAAKNLPALLEILLLQSTSVSAGGRYAIKTLTRYTISAVAMLLVFSTLGLSWSQVQWLVAALGVGIGFGLQEIVANFISGLIILFERPVRVGDVVTIGETTGAVTNIQIRATTIRNWDKQELIVPNKEFITGRLLNWTLTDQLNRIVVNVGVDYGSNARLALDLLGEVAAENERVLKDPAPVISFEGFGDNALLMVLRCYLSATEHRLGVTTELHLAIDEKFRRHGIGIAFPQRDVHLSAEEPLDVRLHRSPPGASPDVDPGVRSS